MRKRVDRLRIFFPLTHTHAYMRESARRPRRRKRNIGVFARARGEIRAAINSEPWGHRLARAQERARGKEAKWPTGQALNKRRERLNKSKLVLPRQPRESRDSRYPRSLSPPLFSCVSSLYLRVSLFLARESASEPCERETRSPIKIAPRASRALTRESREAHIWSCIRFHAACR